MKHLPLKTLSLVGSAVLVAQSSFGNFYQENFDGGNSATNWTAKLSHTDAFANFAFDYGTLGIPSAPNSSGGSTMGMMFLANQSAGVQQGISASPNGQSFTGDFHLRFDMWLNYNGPLGPTSPNIGGNGSTQVGSFGWGTSGASAQWAGASSSIMFGATGDGGSTSDYRLYRNNLLVTTAANYAAGSLNNTASYYTAAFPGGDAAPAAQLGLFPGQTGTTPAGVLGFKWRDVVIHKLGNIVTWSVDGNLIATADTTGATLSGDNIFFGIFDINASSSTDVNDHLITAIYDNIVLVPEPSTAAMMGLGLTLLISRIRNKRA